MMEAVENLITSDLSNGFVEGINNLLKMVKRTMYGKCSLPLLRTKLMLKIEYFRFNICGRTKAFAVVTKYT